MEIFEIAGYKTGVSKEGVNFLQPSDSFQNIKDGYIYRQVLQSRQGFKKFSTGYNSTGHLPTRVMGIFENILTTANSIETLVFDKNFLYVYNGGTNAFDRIPFGGSLFVAGYTGFNITNNEDYISGTTYPKADGSQRFVFTGKGMDRVFFYDGADVKDFTDAADNTDYVAFASGDINKAYHVFWFGERLNFIAPTINSVFYPQGILYSGIRNADGDGDNFNTSGSGLLQLDTYEYITGASILGDRLSINVNRSNWIVEKTRDAFNPYFVRKVPSVLGTDASFSMVSWNDEVKSLGKTGIISTDGRQSLRIDNKLPSFSADEIDGVEFELTYGGFDRINSQFMWSYAEKGLDLTTQNKVLIYNYEERTWSINDQRFSCFGESINGQFVAWDDIDENNNPAWAEWDTTEETWNKIGLEEEVQKTLAGDDLGFIYQLNQDFDDYFVSITGITNASSAVVSTDDQALQVGDKIVFENVEGMTEINGVEALVTARTINTVTVNVDTTRFGTWSAGGSISKVISFSAELAPFNPYRDKGRTCWISHIEFLVDRDIGEVYVDLYQNEESTPFKDNILIQPGNTITRDVADIDISNAPDVQITTTTTAGLQNGSTVTFANVGGTTELNGNPYRISNVTGTTFQIQQSTPSAFTSGGTWTFTEPQLKAREWISVQVNNTVDFLTIAIRQESVSSQFKQTSMRIHCEPAGFTTD